MTKEELLKLKEKISELTEEEKKLRDLYLRKLANGEMQGPPLGYASIDKPWLKYYLEEDIKSSIPKRRIYEDLKNYNQGNLDEIAIEYFGNKITYKRLLENIDRVASSLISNGVKKGDVVSVCMPYLPETIYTIYAINKIGAIVNMIDPRINEELITDYINNAESNYAIIIDKIEDKIKNILPNTSIRKVISVSPLNSHGNFVIKTISKIKRSDFTKWNAFLDETVEDIPTAEYSENELAVIEYTSGTSGIPKGVMLSNESFNSLAHYQFESLKNQVGNKFLLIMPPFIAYGLVIGMHNMLCQGQHLIMIPNFTLDKAPQMLGKLIDEHHPNYIMGVPNFLLILMNYQKDLSFLKGMIIGGDHLDPEIEKKGREYLQKRGSNAGIYKGWGMTEIASCGTFTKNDVENKLGSVGIPLSKNNVKVLKKKENSEERYDIDEPELLYGQEGVLFVSSPATTLGYYKKEDATKKITYLDSQGKKWINTGDIFAIDEDGFLYFKGREKRIVVRPDGHNIPSSQIESIAISHNEVENAVVVGVPSKKYAHGSNAVLCITTNSKDVSQSSILGLLEKIKKDCEENLQPRDRAKYLFVIKELPYTMNGKIDYNKLTEYLNQKINEINIDEESQDVFYIIDDTIIEQNNINSGKKKIKRK